MSPPPLLLFDGHCNLCNATVSGMLWLDKRYAPNARPRLRFASLQSESAKTVLATRGLDPANYIVPDRPSEESVAFLQDGVVFVRSEAILRAVAFLGPVWLYFLCMLLAMVPLLVRDAVYKRVAENRIRLFGKTETCRIATPEEKAAFLRSEKDCEPWTKAM